MLPNDSFISQCLWWYFSLLGLSGPTGSPIHPSSCYLWSGKGFLGSGWWVSLCGGGGPQARLFLSQAHLVMAFSPNRGEQRMLPRSSAYWDPLNPLEPWWDPYCCCPQSLGRGGESQAHRDKVFLGWAICLGGGPSCWGLRIKFLGGGEGHFRASREGEHFP